MKSLYFLFQFILMAFETFTIASISCPPPSIISDTATFLSDLGENWVELLGCGAGAQFSLVDLKSEAKFLTVIIKSSWLI